MKYKIIFPNYRKWFRLYPIILLVVGYFYFVIHLIYLQYKKGHINYRLTIEILLTVAPLFIFIILIYYLVSRISIKLSQTVSVYQNYIEHKIFFIKRKLFFQTFKQIKILEKNDIPKIMKILFETDNIRGVKIEYKRKSRLGPNRKGLLLNVENFDSFLEELKVQLPNNLQLC